MPRSATQEAQSSALSVPAWRQTRHCPRRAAQRRGRGLRGAHTLGSRAIHLGGDRRHHRRAHGPLQPPPSPAAARRRGSQRPRREAELSLLFCDLDHFKDLNDRFGHAQGDEVLKRVADIISRSIRQIDLAARYGGDEFTVILTDAGPEQAHEVAERLRSAVAGAHLQPDGRTSRSASASPPCRTTARRRRMLLERADRAMYEAKHAGRNRCVCFTDCNTSASNRRLITRSASA